ncbi:MAG: M14 family metallopeptidase, partial [Longimicrobiales bacterium]
IYNADGNERVRLSNRPLQYGPIGGMGQRANAQNLDLNRDHMKLESPEARSLALMLQRYDPHVGVDLHTTNGTRHAYHLTYSPPLHPNTDSAIVRLLRDQWLPELTQTIHDEYGWDYYYYGNLQGEGQDRGWYTFDYRPRFNNNYLGLRNRIGILSEAYAYATFEDRILATTRFLEEVLDFAHANATRIREIVARADAASLAGQSLAVRADYERSDTVTILMGDVAEERHPYTGEIMLRRLDVKRPVPMPEFGTFRPTETERVPQAYLVPPELADVIERLAAHGVRTTPLTAAREMEVERFRIDSTTVAAREFQGHRERTLFGAWEPATVAVPAGTLVVTTDQPLGRLTFTLLEPRSADGFVDWNVLDPVLEGAAHYPVLRVHAAVDGR